MTQDQPLTGDLQVRPTNFLDDYDFDDIESMFGTPPLISASDTRWAGGIDPTFADCFLGSGEGSQSRERASHGDGGKREGPPEGERGHREGETPGEVGQREGATSGEMGQREGATSGEGSPAPPQRAAATCTWSV